MAVKKQSRGLEIFSLSFLDIISCGFGAVVMLIMLAKSASVGGTADVERIKSLLQELSHAESVSDELQVRSGQVLSSLSALRSKEKGIRSEFEKSEYRLAALQIQNSQLEEEVQAMQAAAKPAAVISADTTDEEDIFVGGIPVNANYVIFIVDTSGSMQNIWSRVIGKMESILASHPKVKGFQIMNDMGEYLISSYRRKWIPDTNNRRKSALKLLRTWNVFSNSSPVEGLEKALKSYAKAGQKTSIYILGDDYTGPSYDAVLDRISRVNIDKKTRRPLVRIHSIGFFNEAGGDVERFGTLMREVARQSYGTFIALR